MRNLVRYYHTVRYLKFQQCFYRVWRHIYQPKIVSCISDASLKIRALKKPIQSFILKRPNYFQAKNIVFLNHSVDIASEKIWNDSEQEALWLYNLHYFDALHAADSEQVKTAYQLFERWVDENPPFVGRGWEPYPISLRVVNVIKYALLGDELPKKVLQSLYLQARYLYRHCEYHLLGNHLFENFKALCIAGLYFKGKEAENWFHKGFIGLKKQIKEQVLDDGGHFELSPMYHSIVLEGLLDLKNVFQAYDQTFPWDETIEKMSSWLSFMGRSNNELSYFNDAANKMVSSPESLFEYAKLFGFSVRESDQQLAFLKASGYIVLENSRAKVILDVAKVGPNYLPGHAHADTFSFELYIDSFPVFVNLGTSCYGVSSRRSFERSTEAHNTLVVNNENSSEVWSGFRVARRAKPELLVVEQNDKEIVVSARHNGYARFKQGVFHQRTYSFSSNELEVNDKISAAFNTANAYFHLHPDCRIIDQRRKQIVIGLPNQAEVMLEFNDAYVVTESLYAHSFGELRPTKTFVFPLDKLEKNSLITIKW